jgi:Predicted tRNA(5-methylaminomethyl-2-thiouridylate) methyltransferase, contains the PP-loop ATPase domain
MEERKKLIALVSGGLDSLLSVILAKNMGFDIIPVHIETPFNSPCCRDLSLLDRFLKKEGLEMINVKVEREYVEIVRHPKYGYGRALNPCIDCRIFFFKIAKNIMEKEEAAGIITGEVVDQRPKSQNIKAMKIIERESGLEGRVLRPLSGGIMPPTELIKEGLIDPGKLLKIKGKSRKMQIKLARELGLNEIPGSSGGCLLTYVPYARKLEDLFSNDDRYTMEDIYLLKTGRHFRLSKNTKVIVGRNYFENKELEKATGYTKIIPELCNGPVGLFRGDESFLTLAADIVASYCDGDLGSKIALMISGQGKSFKVETTKKDKTLYKKYIVSLK